MPGKPNPALTEVQAEVHRRRSAGESTRHIGRVLGITPATVSTHYARACAKVGETPREPLPPPNRAAVIPEPLPENVEEFVADLPDYERVKRRLRDFNPDHIAGFDRERHLHLTVPHEPFVQVFIGDPHLDSPGHDVEQFERDLETIRQAQADLHCQVIQMGDVLDNWPTGGRLAKKLADGHLTRKEALSLVRGLACEERIDWTLWLIGNHDAWPGIDYATLVRHWLKAPLVDWAAYVTCESAKGFRFVTFASHDMKGSSIHNPVHGLARRAREDGTADLYVAAHRHHGGQGKDEHGFRGKMFNYLRVRGYKRADEYAWQKGFPEDVEGCSGLAVINPLSETLDGRCRTFYSLDEGLDWARFLKARA